MLSIFSQNPTDKNRSHLKNLISMAMADGSMDQREWDLLNEIARKLRLTEEDINLIQKNPDLIENITPRRHKEKVQQLYDLVCLMIADFDIDEGELRFCHKMADKLKLDPLVVDDLIDQVRFYIDQKKDPDRILDDIL
jgi:uncharacterized membrane protein YebE (DUF533 family)